MVTLAFSHLPSDSHHHLIWVAMGSVRTHWSRTPLRLLSDMCKMHLKPPGSDIIQQKDVLRALQI